MNGPSSSARASAILTPALPGLTPGEPQPAGTGWKDGQRVNEMRTWMWSESEEKGCVIHDLGRGLDYSVDRGFVSAVHCKTAAWIGEECEWCGGKGGHQWYLGYGDVDEGACPDCHGTGRNGAHGPTLVRSAPLLRVTFAGKEPYHTFAGWWGWADEAEDDRNIGSPSYLPSCLYDLLPESDVIAPPRGGYNTRQRALDSLSTAALTWARAQPAPAGC